MLDYRLKVFQSVANHLNFTRAAAALHISQPAVTQHVKTLEEHYGTALFLRGPSGISLTASGQLLWEAARRADVLERETDALLRTHQPKLVGPLRIGASTTIAQYFLPPILGRFKVEHREVELSLRIANTREVADAVRAGRIELGFVEGPAPRRDLKASPFYSDELVCVAGPSHPFADRTRISPAELATADVVLREPGSGTREVVERALRRVGVNPRGLRIILETECSETIKGVVASGVGVGFLSHLAIKSEIAAKSLVALPVQGLKLCRRFFFLYPRGPRPSGAANAFMMEVERDRPATRSDERHVPAAVDKPRRQIEKMTAR